MAIWYTGSPATVGLSFVLLPLKDQLVSKVVLGDILVLSKVMKLAGLTVVCPALERPFRNPAPSP